MEIRKNLILSKRVLPFPVMEKSGNLRKMLNQGKIREFDSQTLCSPRHVMRTVRGEGRPWHARVIDL